MSLIKRITARAKAIRKGTSMKWLTALKKAGAELRGGKKPKPKKSVARARKTKRIAPAASDRPGLAPAKSEYRKALEDNLARLLFRREMAAGKMDRRRLTKQINEVRSDLRHVRN